MRGALGLPAFEDRLTAVDRVLPDWPAFAEGGGCYLSQDTAAQLGVAVAVGGAVVGLEVVAALVAGRADVLPQQRSYYTYSGSLTTPPCSEGVRWFVLKDPVFVSQEAIDNLHLIISLFPGYDGYDKNNRPVRPLNGRAVLDRVAQ